MRTLILAISLASIYGCGRTAPVGPSPVPADPAAPSPAATLSGIVFEQTAAGQSPLEGVTVIVTPPTRDSTSFKVTTDANGFYQFSKLPAVASQVDVVVISGPYGSVTQRLTVDGDTRFDVELVRRLVYTLSGVITEVTADGATPIEGVEIAVWTCDGRTYNCAAYQYLTTITDSRGAYSIPGVWGGEAAGVFATRRGYRVEGDPPLYCDGCDRLVTLSSDTQLDLRMVR